MDVAATISGDGYVLCARTSTRDVQVLLWYLYEHDLAGAAVLLVQNMLRFWVGDGKNGDFSVVGFLGRLENSAGF